MIKKFIVYIMNLDNIYGLDMPKIKTTVNNKGKLPKESDKEYSDHKKKLEDLEKERQKLGNLEKEHQKLGDLKEDRQKLGDLKEDRQKLENEIAEKAKKLHKKREEMKSVGRIFGGFALCALAMPIATAVTGYFYVAAAAVILGIVPCAIISARYFYKASRFNVDSHLTELYEKHNLLENEIDSLENEIDSLENEIDSLENEIDSLENEIDSLENEIDSLENEISAVQEEPDKSTEVTADSHSQPEYADPLKTAEKEKAGPESPESTVTGDMSVPEKSESTRIDSDAIIRELTDIASSAAKAREKGDHPGLIYKGYLSTIYSMMHERDKDEGISKPQEKKDLSQELAEVYKHFHAEIYNNTEHSAEAAVICREIVNKFAKKIRPHLQGYPMEIQLMGELSHADGELERLRKQRQIDINYKSAYPVKTSEDQAVRLIFSAKKIHDDYIIGDIGDTVLFHTIKDPREVKKTIDKDAAIICETEGADGKITRFENLKDFFAARKEFLSQNSDETKKFWHDLLYSATLYHSAQRSSARAFQEDAEVTRYVAYEIFSSFTEALKSFNQEGRKNALEAFVAGSNLAVQDIKVDYSGGFRYVWSYFPDADEIFPEEIEYNYAKNHEEAFVFRVKEKKTSLDKDSQPSTNFAANHYPQSNTRPDNDPEKKGMSLGS